MTIKNSYLVSTDLDGTLLDHHCYRWEAASEALKYLNKNDIPVIFNTSKTLAEAAVLQNKIGLSGPLIVENGSAIAIPNDYSCIEEIIAGEKTLQVSHHILVEFGESRASILEFIKRQRNKHGDILSGYSNWEAEEIAEKTGLDIEQAQLSSQKLYSEPFLWQADELTLEKFIDNATLAGLKVMKGGRFFHIQGNTTKAVPILWLKHKLETIHQNKVFTLICLGDNHNDIHMLDVADIPVCIRSPTGGFPPIKSNPCTIRTEKFGPEGWQEAMDIIFSVDKIL